MTTLFALAVLVFVVEFSRASWACPCYVASVPPCSVLLFSVLYFVACWRVDYRCDHRFFFVSKWSDNAQCFEGLWRLDVTEVVPSSKTTIMTTASAVPTTRRSTSIPSPVCLPRVPGEGTGEARGGVRQVCLLAQLPAAQRGARPQSQRDKDTVSFSWGGVVVPLCVASSCCFAVICCAERRCCGC